MNKFSVLPNILLVVSLCCVTLGMKAQNAKNGSASEPLFQTIAALDSSLFEAYNQCDLEKMGSLITEDLEFYHDKTGLSIGKQRFLQDIQKNICGKVRRDLVPGSLEVYPLNGYGAVEIGIHRFHHPSHEEDGVGEAKFVILWQNKGGKWKIARAISYDHAPVSK